ncbi:MAG: phosphoribosylformylglycinamidine synthase subunit PurL [Pirellulaceae bacterium]|nr:phosphoribosylformylglycinamidine synthase subunit PurL [Pirellulaceae bacterium]
MTLWQIEIVPAKGYVDRKGLEIDQEAKELGLSTIGTPQTASGYLVQGDLSEETVTALAKNLFSDQVVEQFSVNKVTTEGKLGNGQIRLYVLPLPGVTDAVAESALKTAKRLGYDIETIRTFSRYLFEGARQNEAEILAEKLLANGSIEQTIWGNFPFTEIQPSSPYVLQKREIELLEATDEEMVAISKEWQLSLSLVEMKTIQAHYRSLSRQPTDIELETIAQTWSEHCSHKTLAGKIEYHDENGVRHYENMLKETIFAATNRLRKQWGKNDWCVSVFKDNAGIVRFDEENNISFKVETHNRPSALEPYGGANTGIGGVLRDTMGTGLGARPICSTDVFCFADPHTEAKELPPGTLHPKRIMKGVVSGVRDYGNRMGIPTVNGAVYFDKRYVGNPLVFCGNVGILPREKSFKEAMPGDYIVAIGGKTGRDGIHGATFSSAELTSESDTLSGGAVQIGNAITEKMVLDVLLAARDKNLYSAVTDCGAGGFSSAIGEMGEEIGAEVWLDKAPLKYEGLSYTEIWISEAQERMVFSVPPENWPAFKKLCQAESVEACWIGLFKPTGNLELKYGDEQVGILSMDFMHNGRPPIVRKATYSPTEVTPFPLEKVASEATQDRLENSLLKILSSLNVASKESIIRQYDHEVQSGSFIKPLVGLKNDGPGNASVICPVLGSRRGVVVSCGMNPYYGDHDTYHMTTSSIDEAIRNCVAVGADPAKIALLDNFCWGHTDRPETLGSLVRAAIACQEAALAFETPFISGKDSLHNEFSYNDPQGQRQTISIPATLLISAMGQIADASRALTMDLKEEGNALYLVGLTKNEWAGSHFGLVNDLTAGEVPKVDFVVAKETFTKLHQAIDKRLLRACHDLSEGGFAVAAAEMAFSGQLGLELNLDNVLLKRELQTLPAKQQNLIALFAESNTRFLCEVTPENRATFEETLSGIPVAHVGTVTQTDTLEVTSTREGSKKIVLRNADLKEAWQRPLRS